MQSATSSKQVSCCAALQLQADRATAAVNLEARYQVPPHLLFELLADPTQHDKIFDAILVSSILGYQGQQRSHSLHAEIPAATADFQCRQYMAKHLSKSVAMQLSSDADCAAPLFAVHILFRVPCWGS